MLIVNAYFMINIDHMFKIAYVACLNLNIGFQLLKFKYSIWTFDNLTNYKTYLQRLSNNWLRINKTFKQLVTNLRSVFEMATQICE